MVSSVSVFIDAAAKLAIYHHAPASIDHVSVGVGG